MSSRNAANPNEIHVNAVKVRYLVIRIIMYIIYKEFLYFKYIQLLKESNNLNFTHTNMHTYTHERERRKRESLG